MSKPVCMRLQGGMQSALEEQLAARTSEVQSFKDEARRLRAALVDAEMELQRLTSAHEV